MRYKNRFSKLFIFGFMSIAVSLCAFGFIHQNGAGGGYGSSGEAISSRSSGTIDLYIVQGAGYFLNSYGDVIALLNRVEMSGVNGFDLAEVQEIVERALTNLTNAREIYSALIDTAENTPYNPTVLEKLKSFDYGALQEANALNPVILKEVESYLKKGDITGTFKKSDAGFAGMIALLNSLKNEIAQGKMPSLDSLWELNQAFSTQLLFGQYEAQVFDAIL